MIFASFVRPCICATLLLATIVPATAGPACNFTMQQARSVQPGMSLGDVNAALGCAETHDRTIDDGVSYVWTSHAATGTGKARAYPTVSATLMKDKVVFAIFDTTTKPKKKQ